MTTLTLDQKSCERPMQVRRPALSMDTVRSRDSAVSLRISVTDRCQLRCAFCTPPEGVKKIDRDRIMSFEQILAFTRFLRSHFGLTKVHLTGGEPLLRKGIADLISMLARENVPDLALTTNGQIPEMIENLKQAGLRRINISLASLNKETFRQLTCGGELERTLTAVHSARRHGLAPIKLNVIVLRNANDGEVIDIARFGLETGCEVRFLELMPIGATTASFNALFVSSAHVQERLKTLFDLRALNWEPGSSSRRFTITDSKGRRGNIGFISSCSAPFCRECNRLRLTADGRLLGCLALDGGPEIKPWFTHGKPHDEPGLVALINRVLGLKRRNGAFTTTRAMISVGG